MHNFSLIFVCLYLRWLIWCVSVVQKLLSRGGKSCYKVLAATKSCSKL